MRLDRLDQVGRVELGDLGRVHVGNDRRDAQRGVEQGKNVQAGQVDLAVGVSHLALQQVDLGLEHAVCKDDALGDACAARGKGHRCFVVDRGRGDGKWIAAL